MNRKEDTLQSLLQMTPFERELKKWYICHNKLMPDSVFLKMAEQFRELSLGSQSTTANLDASYQRFTDAHYDSTRKIADPGTGFMADLDVPFLLFKHPRYFPLMIYETKQVNITYILSGRCETHIYRKEQEDIFSLKAGDFMFIPAASQVAHSVSDDDSLVLNMAMNETMFRRIINSAFSSGILVEFYTRCVNGGSGGTELIFHTGSDAFIRSLMEQLLEDGNKTGQTFSEVTYLAISLIFAYMQREYGRDLELSDSSRGPYHIPAMIEYIQEHYQDFDSRQMADHFHLSSSYLSRLFRQQTDHTLSEVVQEIRIKIAQNLLQYTENSIVDVAEKVGYNDTSYFIEIFRKKTGKTPLQYRRMSGRE